MTKPTCSQCIHGWVHSPTECSHPTPLKAGVIHWITNHWPADDDTPHPEGATCPGYHPEEALVPATTKITHDPSGCYTIDVTPPAGAPDWSKSDALREARKAGNAIGIPSWALRAAHYKKNNILQYRYKTGTNEELERQWVTLKKQGVLPKDSPMPPIIGSAQVDVSRRVKRKTPPESLTRKLTKSQAGYLNDIWHLYTSDQGYSDTTLGSNTRWPGVSGSAIRRMREACGLPPRLEQGTRKTAPLPDVCFEVAESKPINDVTERLSRLVHQLGLTYPRGQDVPWSQVFTDMEIKISSLKARPLPGGHDLGSLERRHFDALKEQVPNLERRVINQRKELRKLQRLPDLPRISRVRIQESAAGLRGAEVEIWCGEGDQATRLVYKYATVRPVEDIVREFRDRGFRIPPVEAFQVVRGPETRGRGFDLLRSSIYEWPVREKLVDVGTLIPTAPGLGLVKLPEGSFYRATNPGLAAALANTDHPFRVPVRTKHGRKWVALEPGLQYDW